MNDTNAVNFHHYLLKIILRVIGTSSLLALFFVFAPYSLMNQIHTLLGMGVLSEQPVVGYLARSSSALYALLGGLMWIISCNLEKHQLVLRYLGFASVLFGAILIWVDWTEGMPEFWKYWEGPFVILFGLSILILERGAQNNTMFKKFVTHSTGDDGID